jgi:hypothetical protein
MTKKVTVVKVPLPPGVRKEYPKAFPRMPILYLELVENKSRIKPEVVNKDYVPAGALSGGSGVEKSVPVLPPIEKSLAIFDETKEDFSDSQSPGVEMKKVSRDSRSSLDSRSSPDRGIFQRDKLTRDKPTRDYPPIEFEDEVSARSSPSISEVSESPTRKDLTGSSAGSDRGKKDKISYRLRELLEDDGVGDNLPTEDNLPTHNFAGGSNNPPTLNDLARSGQIARRKEMMDVGHITMNDQDRDDAKRELLFKFELLKKSYKTDNIPEFSLHSDYDTMKRSYESTVRTLSLDRSVDDYKKYLSYGFIGMEFVLGHVFKLDMSGFARQQMVSMSSYERLLIELGEKSYVPTGSKWPVEVRLIFLVVVNTAVFLVSRMMMKKTGSDFMGMMNNMSGIPSQTSGGIPQRKRKMKGPTLNVDDIPDINEATEN